MAFGELPPLLDEDEGCFGADSPARLVALEDDPIDTDRGGMGSFLQRGRFAKYLDAAFAQAINGIRKRIAIGAGKDHSIGFGGGRKRVEERRAVAGPKENARNATRESRDLDKRFGRPSLIDGEFEIENSNRSGAGARNG
jgi:hypothetical protein